MGSKSIASVTLFLSLNLFFFSMVSSNALVPAPPPECPELGLCLDVLNLGNTLSPGNNCCSILGGLVQVNATVCICDKARTQILGIPLNINLVVSQIIDLCRQNQTFTCN
ncbi:hypothetical protein PHAVU_006G138600 [Phaseolus vulgaris]|uniref:Hydrophobic seed protein domain-containing protein n=1 Tax=Phaseolus vulgaris TaxID=3885 RepID=V7BSP9_PHAVU|nr:hypothetical protein PHAVU_006G138600g [Phaseolus vulgaris]ESW19596.1 hypothetical protein PHAVU_006G138600g [Phaseolus vulgaris]